MFLFSGLNFYGHDIFYQITHNNLKSVKALIKSEFDASVRNQDGQSILHLAVLTGDKSMVKAVLKSKTPVNALDYEGKTALDYAVEYGSKQIILELIKHKAKVTTRENEDYALYIIKERSFYLLNFTEIVHQIAMSVYMVLGGVFFLSAWTHNQDIACLTFLIGGCLLIPLGLVNLGLAISNIPWHIRAHRSYLLHPYEVTITR